MECTRRGFIALASAGATLAATACAPQQPSEEEPEPVQVKTEARKLQVDEDEFSELAIDATAWRYDEENDCFYQLGLSYCTAPASPKLEQLAIFVPGAYFKAERGKGEAYACTVNPSARVGSFTPETAPVLMPINAVRYGDQEPPASYGYAGLSRYLKAGIVYVYAGFRGRSATLESGSREAVPGGAPWPVVDLKAAIRFLRYNADVLPCDTERIATCGLGGAGGIGATVGASGDSPLFAPYLAEIGAASHDASGSHLSDAVFASALWCPITSFDVADAAYEWECGQYASSEGRGEGTWGALLSRDLTASYASWLDEVGLVDRDGRALTLDATGDATYVTGSYYDHVLSLVEDAAAEFMGMTQFPYTYTPAPVSTPAFPGNPGLTLSGSHDADAAIAEASGETPAGVSRVSSIVYDSPDSYIEALNAELGTRWITYSASLATARIGGLWDVARLRTQGALELCAYDSMLRSSVANQLFGVTDMTTLHFSRLVADVLSEGSADYAQADGWNSVYPREWAVDLTREDEQGNAVERRVNMMNPLFFLCDAYQGFGTSSVAPHWRVNVGLFQAESSLAVAVNLALALSSYVGVSDVSLSTVWGRGFELAERAGDAQDALVDWLKECCME